MGDAEAVHIRTDTGAPPDDFKAVGVATPRSVRFHHHPFGARHRYRFVAFNDFGHFQPAKSYLFSKGIDRLPPFVPLLSELAESGPVLFVATVLLNLLEVSPRTVHLRLICGAAQRWMCVHPESREFWVGHAIGRRVCAVLTAILALDPKLFGTDQPVRREIDTLLGKLIRLGVAESHGLEEALRKSP